MQSPQNCSYYPHQSHVFPARSDHKATGRGFDLLQTDWLNSLRPELQVYANDLVLAKSLLSVYFGVDRWENVLPMSTAL